MLNIKRKIIFQKDAKLFDIHLSRKLLEQINHTGSVENIEITFSLMEEIYENRDIRFLLFELKPKSLFKNKKQNILLNRDIIYYKLNGNKEQARHIHYLMVVYSNYKDEEFYNPNYENNMRYFLELEKYHSNDKNKL
ncbi:hypothetical protein NPA08_03870 [Mycoplasmopsis citelli]|uniref:hypothetical protein n=1 Tax=Mycoplasmopsis citelli TaxID=171281 RepID=UPI002114DB51|nr:hypothetical protein [Mycoplasmopsis citelli]UUD36064.1 hypothetical protein NPA08_03870 [Mycoplasmopsis citelli]